MENLEIREIGFFFEIFCDFAWQVQGGKCRQPGISKQIISFMTPNSDDIMDQKIVPIGIILHIRSLSHEIFVLY